MRVRECIKLDFKKKKYDSKKIINIAHMKTWKKPISNQDEVIKRFNDKMKKGFYNREFYLDYQPYYDVSLRKVSGFEALIRWHSDELGQVSPHKLICSAEETGLIIEIGNWVIKEACHFAKQINIIAQTKLTISINISVVQLMETKFISNLEKQLRDTGISPGLIHLEITESVLLDSIEKGVMKLNELKDRGFLIALDDFGTGYSSLRYFKELPVDILKIDKAFIDNIAVNEYDRAIVEMIIKMAHKRYVVIYAEGVENYQQYEVLNKLASDMIQGYLFSKPLGKLYIISNIQEIISRQL